ncbi:MAG: helix-turn-helix transcriptional regulator [Pseudomonadota bacterium]
MIQKDVSPLLGIDVYTLLLWEKNRTQPMEKHYPAIVEFLGYCPYVYPKSEGERFRLHRIYRGFTQKLTAKFLVVDPMTISRWEADQGTGWPDHEKKINRFLTSTVTPEEVAQKLRSNPDYYSIPQNPKTLGEQLRKARLERKMTLSEVAELIGVHSSRTVGAWERNEKVPSKQNTRKIIGFIS